MNINEKKKLIENCDCKDKTFPGEQEKQLVPSGVSCFFLCGIYIYGKMVK
ncbi:MAG: hypothetical protein MRZ49_02785 [Lachnospiraceae bacterium]|nr:hypothetical protein [Lachnospiraceae bacterium]